ncbi:hypothetical protein L1987_19706 [Smallanthus sonchifolius]|uniref:Uncharacterized protein n=1 Tax=Smallanthus sonchifolius TaxID=185202 RepID=A0ACB9IPD8_9ASTR|nr:hypothetical protein L1987_19706 [Smallanthus sonchifolius]
MRGHLTEKADVFSYGVVALEIISGKPNSDSTLEDEKIYLLEWAWNLHEAKNEVELVDKELSEFDENEVKRVTRIALLCTQTSPMQRPPMSPSGGNAFRGHGSKCCYYSTRVFGWF